MFKEKEKLTCNNRKDKEGTLFNGVQNLGEEGQEGIQVAEICGHFIKFFYLLYKDE